ncbi:hypothetical protein [Paraburkholderia oxyphila]|uniref:hypothetical protein n=1 Tax=Paraburkholderia oxyphila TaxID=614212 RepID=UPI000A6C8812|nr:hypothetical protein [Paraburkholderia oxyphila]
MRRLSRLLIEKAQADVLSDFAGFGESALPFSAVPLRGRPLPDRHKRGKRDEIADNPGKLPTGAGILTSWHGASPCFAAYSQLSRSRQE